jgi:hypothetical protein
MVNFNNETTVTQAPADLVKITRLEKRYNLFEALEAYYKDDLQGQDTDRELVVVAVRALNLMWELQGELKRKKKDLILIRDNLLSQNKIKIIQEIEDLNLFCDEIGLTRIDVKKIYDTTRVENENREKKI